MVIVDIKSIATLEVISLHSTLCYILVHVYPSILQYIPAPVYSIYSVLQYNVPIPVHSIITPLYLEPLSEGFLRSLSSTISTQRCTPLRLGSYLELSNQEVADIARQAPNEQERTYLMLRAWGERKRKGRGTLVAILTKAGLYTDIEQSTKAVGKLIKHCAVTRGGSHVSGVRTHVARDEWHIAEAGGGCV